MIKSENYRAEKVAFPDGDGCCIWIPFPDNEDAGICFDFAADHIDELIALLTELKTVPAEPLDKEE